MLLDLLESIMLGFFAKISISHWNFIAIFLVSLFFPVLFRFWVFYEMLQVVLNPYHWLIHIYQE